LLTAERKTEFKITYAVYGKCERRHHSDLSRRSKLFERRRKVFLFSKVNTWAGFEGSKKMKNRQKFPGWREVFRA
jgi:hypothetical protein